MLLGFKDRFVQYVANGSKTHTIRRLSKRRPFVQGDHCDCYSNVRQKTMRLIGRWPCVKVEEIEIHQLYESEACPLYVLIDGQALSPDETEALFFRDGFRTPNDQVYFPHTKEALAFWQNRLPFKGQLIHWDFQRAHAVKVQSNELRKKRQNKRNQKQCTQKNS